MAMILLPRRYRYDYGVLAPNAPQRSVARPLAAENIAAIQPTAVNDAVRANETDATGEPVHRKAVRYAWTHMLVSNKCGGDPRIIVFYQLRPVIHETLSYLGV